ncbi:RecQ family ATP-dependent DNA helicase [Gryllotalpicola ginsengisoli]|uniref:RecQ family ATP-dependent DNA helicase n=1 Tax=Gryllotalpicola ginsengisoli TaxID=444608 RepID=UPI0003B47E32|nr:RecQ family ATP-dependent DNA helicase [Gryllotalpicola ginsengisoli]
MTPRPASADTTRDPADIAREVFGLPDLRSGIADAIDAVLAGHDTLAVMPTGYGKSTVYGVTGIARGGVTVVFSPLIALQTDQVEKLRAAPGHPIAVAVNSRRGGTLAAARRALDGAEAGFLFLAPEQLDNERVVEWLRELPVRLVAVDEAHCVSTWGHDFRPDYAALGERLEALGRPQLVALTATGSAPVRQDIVEVLRLREPVLIARGFDRPNLRLEVARFETDDEKREAVARRVRALPQPGIVYVSTRAETTRGAERMTAAGLRAAAYHGSLRSAERDEVLRAFLDGELDVVVATSAFGMGVDKPDVRYVVHADVPDSLDIYYHEAGRAGRDGEPAQAILHYRPEDFALTSFFNGGLPDADELHRAYTAIAAAGGGAGTEAGTDGGLGRRELAARLGLSTRTVSRLVNLLEDAGAVATSGRTLRAVGGEPDQAVETALEAARRRERVADSRMEMMRAYAETLGCRRQALLGYFGEELAEPCGNCDTCESGSAYEQRDDRAAHAAAHESRADQGGPPDAPFPVDARVEHRQWGPGVVMRAEPDRVTVFFESEGYKVLSLDAVEEEDLLTRA